MEINKDLKLVYCQSLGNGRMRFLYETIPKPKKKRSAKQLKALRRRFAIRRDMDRKKSHWK